MDVLGRAWPPALIGVKSLNPYTVESRYPGYIHQLSRAEVRAAIETAEKVVTWAETVLTQPPSLPGANSE